MGNCVACLSSTDSVHHSSEEELESIKVVRTTDGELFEYPGPVFVKDLMYGFEGFAVFQNHNSVKQPLHPDTELKLNEVYYLKPWTKPEINEVKDAQGRKLMGSSDSALDLEGDLISFNDEERITSAQGPKDSIREVKVKKVTFADEVVSISSSDQLINPISNQEYSALIQNQELSHKQNGVVRLKVVISKKQLTELMSPTTTEKQADALMEKMIAPLLSPKSSMNKSDSYGILSPTWRPSLEHIPEDHD